MSPNKESKNKMSKEPLSHLDQARLDALADIIVAAGIPSERGPGLPVLSLGAARWYRDTMLDRGEEFDEALTRAIERSGADPETIEYRGFAVRLEHGDLIIMPIDRPPFLYPGDYTEIDAHTVYQEFEPYEGRAA